MTTTVKLTSDTITDDQIQQLGNDAASGGRYAIAMWCDYALLTNPERYDIPRGCDRRTARQRCADAINAARAQVDA